MSRFLKWLVSFVRSLLTGMLVEVVIFFMFVFAGISWLYFSSVFAAIPVVVIGFALGIYIYGLEEKKSDKKGK